MIEDTTPLPILDTHQHLWDLDRLRLPWIEKGSVLDRSFLMEEYLREAEGLNIVKTIYMEVAVNRAQRGEEAEYVLELCARSDNPMVGAVMGGDPGAPEFGEFVRRYRDNPHFKGVRGGFLRAGDGPPPTQSATCACWASWECASTWAQDRRSPLPSNWWKPARKPASS